MNPEQKKLLRDALVAALVAANPVSLPLETLRGAARSAGFSIDATTVEAEMHYLIGKGLAEPRSEELSAGVKRWIVTSAGVDYAEREGLA